MSLTRAMTTTSARVKPTKQSSYEVAMTKNRVRINTPKLGQRASEELNKVKSVRVHNRFQGLLVSIIESANFANFRLTDHPVEAYHPDFEQGGGFCDLVLRRRKTNDNVALLEVKTRRVPSSDKRSPMGVASDVLNSMGPRLLQLQQAAREEDALWVVAVGMYKPPILSAAQYWATDFSVVMIWGREVGHGSPHGHYYWSDLYALDTSMNGFERVEDFWSLIRSAPPRPPRAAAPPPEPHVELEPILTGGTLFDTIPSTNQTVEEILQAYPRMKKSERASVTLAQNWPDYSCDLKTAYKRVDSKEMSFSAIAEATRRLAKIGVIGGYTPRRRDHQLFVNKDKLTQYLRAKNAEKL